MGKAMAKLKGKGKIKDKDKDKDKGKGKTKLKNKTKQTWLRRRLMRLCLHREATSLWLRPAPTWN
jgi:hypothetical protein